MSASQIIRLHVPFGTLVVGRRAAFASAYGQIKALTNDEIHRFLMTTLANPAHFDATRRFWAINQFNPLPVRTTTPGALAERIAQMCAQGTLLSYFVPPRPSFQRSAALRAESAITASSKAHPVNLFLRPIGRNAENAAEVRVQSLSIEERLFEVVRRSAPHIPPGIRHEFETILEFRMFSNTVATMAIWADANDFGVGVLVDSILQGSGVGFADYTAVDAAGKMFQLLDITRRATRPEDLEDAGVLLAGAIARVGVKAFLTIITRGTNRTTGAPVLPDGWRPPPPETRKAPERFLQRTPRSSASSGSKNGAAKPVGGGGGGSGGGGSAGTGGAKSNAAPHPLDGKLPKTVADAPAEVTLPETVSKQMQDSFKNSFPGGKSQERGGTFVVDNKGDLSVANESSGTSGTFQPNRTVGAGQTVTGTYHTHPYDASEGGHEGVSFSGADINYAAHYKEPIVVDAGNKQFMITPTGETPANTAQINNDWDTAFAAALANGDSIQDASAGATKSVANKYKMAYYEGTDGALKKVP